jgi:hydrogenase expression/formation protein HypD
MKYIDEFRDISLIKKISERINETMPHGDINIMEVCGTHTQNFFRFGLNGLMPPNLRFISGPGCPVCVSPQEYIDNAIKLARDKDNVIVTFGDMLRIPGSDSTLEKVRAENGNIKVTYSPLDSILFAHRNPDKKVIFLAVGFETTAPTIALSIIKAKKENIKNIFFYSSLKTIPQAMEHLAQDKRLKLSGFLCPGHVSCIIGTKSYEFIPRKYKIGCCISGFEPVDILEGIYLLIRQLVDNKPRVQNQYMRAVTSQGNLKAQKAINEVFKTSDTSWRGLGIIPESGLRIKDKFSGFDAEKKFNLSRKPRALSRELRKCRCGDILKGLISPAECPLFAKTCDPQRPLGPCMVSSEGACNAYYRYR